MQRLPASAKLFVLAAGCALLACAAAAAPRADKRFDGPWQFRIDPDNEGEKGGWFLEEEPFAASATVPGCWDAEGVGEPTDKLFHNYVGKAWYRREEPIPENWEGQRIWIEVGGAHRYMDLWVNGQHVGRQIGYLSPVVADITGLARPGTSALLAIRVDSKQDWTFDPLTGCFDVIDAMDIAWGGIYRPVRLYTTGQTWISDVFVVPHALQAAAEVRISVRGVAPPGLKVRVAIVGDSAGAGPTRPRLSPCRGPARRPLPSLYPCLAHSFGPRRTPSCTGPQCTWRPTLATWTN